MYSFEDLAALDRKGLRSLLDSIPSERLTLALKTASPQLKEKVFASMSRRAADRLKEEMQLLGGVKLAEVEAAQREIVEQALVLVADGVISLEGDSDLV
jgi:flagellar motor switch protein FliG